MKKSFNLQLLLTLLLIWSSVLSAQEKSINIKQDVHRAVLEDFDLIKMNIQRYHPSHWPEFERIQSEAYKSESLILESDVTPVDVILRRTEAMIKERQLTSEAKKLQALQKKNKQDLSLEQQKTLFIEVAALRRKVMFSHPLVDFNSILFAKNDPMVRGFVHMVDQYFGLNQRKNGGIYKLENSFSDHPKLTDVLQNSTVANGRLKGEKLGFNSGAFISLDLNYEANKIMFAFSEVNIDGWQDSLNWKGQPWKHTDAWGYKFSPRYMHYMWKPESSFHIFEADMDKGEIRQLTDGMWDDFDPCYLPNDRVAFVSARCGGNQRCGWRYLPTYTLHTMMPDGQDIQQLSFHDTNEWYPSINNDGMLIYTRWDYVDRDANIAHHLWTCYPDGRDPRSSHGNYPLIQQSRPWFEGHIRAIPKSNRYLGIAAPHHGEAFGSLILIDQSIPDDKAMSQVKRISPLLAFPESESTPGKMAPTNNKYKLGSPEYQADWKYSTPWPLSEDLYLCVYDPYGSKKDINSSVGNNHGIYLVDAFGNRELIYRDTTISCVDPIPFRPRKKEHIYPVQTKQMKVDRDEDEDLSMATVSIMNAYESEYPIPEGVKIKELRIVNLFPKDSHDRGKPMIGKGLESLARGVLGTVPVEEDGSAYFKCPTGMGIYFQILDKNGVMIHNMRSATYLHPGESLSCIGCHENKWEAPKNMKLPMAIRRKPSVIKPEATGSYPLTFPRLVQPVLDKKCVACHQEKVPEKSLSGERFGKYGWSEAMKTLEPYAWAKHGSMFGRIKNKRSYSLPMQEGANDSKFYQMLKEGHHGVELTNEEMRRITLWLDCNSNFYGAYHDTEKQANGEVVLPNVGLPKWLKDASTIVR